MPTWLDKHCFREYPSADCLYGCTSTPIDNANELPSAQHLHGYTSTPNNISGEYPSGLCLHGYRSTSVVSIQVYNTYMAT